MLQSPSSQLTPAQVKWRSLRYPLRIQIEAILAEYTKRKFIPHVVMKKKQKYDEYVTSNTVSNSIAHEHFCMAFYESLDLLDLLRDVASCLRCYHNINDDSYILLSGVLRESHDENKGTTVVVLEGDLIGHHGSDIAYKVAVKWYQGQMYTTKHEMEMYRAIKKINKNALPWISLSYTLWNQPVMVTKMLTTLDASDNEINVGIDCLERLKTIHDVCIHSDIKPDNIMKDIDGKYYIIDMGASSVTKTKRGHKRYVRTHKYMHPGTDHYTNIRTDLWELLYTMRNIQLNRLGKSGDIRSGFTGGLKKYKKVLESLPEYPNKDVYDQLINILNA